MAQNSSMDAATLNQAANDCRDAKQLIATQANQVDNSKVTVLSSWKSPAARSFGSAVDMWVEKTKRLSNDIDRIAELLDTTAKQNVDQDEEQAGVFGKFGGMLGG